MGFEAAVLDIGILLMWCDYFMYYFYVLVRSLNQAGEHNVRFPCPRDDKFRYFDQYRCSRVNEPRIESEFWTNSSMMVILRC